jgi:hypothetical protein
MQRGTGARALAAPAFAPLPPAPPSLGPCCFNARWPGPAAGWASSGSCAARMAPEAAPAGAAPPPCRAKALSGGCPAACGAGAAPPLGPANSISNPLPSPPGPSLPFQPSWWLKILLVLTPRVGLLRSIKGDSVQLAVASSSMNHSPAALSALALLSAPVMQMTW